MRIRGRRYGWLAVAAVAGLALVAWAPQAADATHPAAYKVEFELQASQTGKAAESHRYTLVVDATANGRSSLHVGGRVPVHAGDGVNYENTGVELDCTVRDANHAPAGQVRLNVDMSLTSVVPQTSPATPTFQVASAQVATEVPLGQNVAIAHFEAPDGSRSYELSVHAVAAQ